MKYMLTWTVRPENQAESLMRWKEHGPNPPEGVKLLGHYWKVNSLGGWAFFEADSHQKITQWLLPWTDLNVNEVIPIIEDKEMNAILK